MGLMCGGEVDQECRERRKASGGKWAEFALVYKVLGVTIHVGRVRWTKHELVDSPALS